MILKTKFCLLIGVLICSIVIAQKYNDQVRPNIILIMADDLGWGDVGFNGNQNVQTPNLDDLASEGVIFNHFYSASSVCSPTRASCLTGRNPYRQGIYTANRGHLKKEEITLAEILKQEGYVTGMFGKWHLGTLTTKIKDANRGKPGDDKHYSPPDWHGFDEYYVTESKVPTYDPMIYPAIMDTLNGESKRFGWSAIVNDDKELIYGTSYWQGKDKKVINADLKGENTKLIMDQALMFIDKAADHDKPFFTVIWIHTPHLPVVTDKDHRNLYKDFSHEEQLYYGSITAMDEQIGRLKKFLIAKNEYKNTMIWFASDNGPEVRTPGSAGNYRGKKRDLYDGGIRVPAFCVWPDSIKAGQNMTTLAVTSDYLPSISSMLNLEIQLNRPLDGIDLSRHIFNGVQERNSAIGFQYPNRMSWISENYKLIRNKKDADFELFNLKLDPFEEKNIVNEFPELTDKLKKDLYQWVASCKKSEMGMDYGK